MSGVKGTNKWFAPEQLTESSTYNNYHTDNSQQVLPDTFSSRGTNKSDVFSEGLVFASILLGGQHPYNSDLDVIAENPVNLKNLPFEYKWVKFLLLDVMLKKEPNQRPDVGQIVERLEKYLTRRHKMESKTEIDMATKREERRKYIQRKIQSGSFKFVIQLFGQQQNFYSLPVNEGSTTSSGLPFFIYDGSNNFSSHDFYRNQSTKHKVIMLIGADKRSKSRFINGMVNFMFGVEYQDNYRLQLINENSGLPHNVIRRVDPWRETVAYKIQHQDKISAVPYSVTIIDTPTYGETRRTLKIKK